MIRPILSAVHALDRSFTQIDRHNFRINIIEGVLYLAGASFLSAQTVLPALVSRLGGSNIAVGSVAVLLWVGLFLPQIFAARFVETRPWKKPWAIWGGAIQRLSVLLLALCVLLVGHASPAVALWCVLICYAVNQVALGITTPGWFDLYAKVTPPRSRGRLGGIKSSIGGIVSFGCGLVLTWLLAHIDFPESYGFAFLLAFALEGVSLIVQARLVEEQPSTTVSRRPIRMYLDHLPAVFRQNPEFRNFMIMSAFLVTATMPMGFFTVYALNRFGVDEAIVGEFTLAMIGIQVVSAFVNGFVADHYSHKIALVCAATGMLCASIWACVAPSAGWFMLVYVFMGINLGSELMLRYNMAVEFGPVEQRSTYIGLMNTLLAPMYLSSLIGGWIIDHLGFKVVFGLGALSSAVGIALLIWRVVDPQTLRAKTLAAGVDNVIGEDGVP